MELKRYLAILWRRKWALMTTVALTLFTALVGMQLIRPKYTATATVRVIASTGGSVSWNDIQYADRLMNTYSKILESVPIRDQIQQQLGLDRPPSVKVEIFANTELMQISVVDQDPTRARDTANKLVTILVGYNQTMAQQTNMLTPIQPATLPKQPSSPQPNLIIGVAVLVGLVGGLGLSFLLEHLDTRLYTREQIAGATTLPTLAAIPAARPASRYIFQNDASPQLEAFRYLRTAIFTPERDNYLRTILVTSAEPREGKSTVTANLACATAQLGRRVVIVDADMRLPTLHRIFGLPNTVGLSSLLRQETTLPSGVQSSRSSGCDVITSGPLPSNSAELLASPRMAELITQLVQEYDTVMVDAPAILAVTDAAILAPLVDGVVLVVGRAQARPTTLRDAQEQLTSVHARPVGVVVNRAESDTSYSYYTSRH